MSIIESFRKTIAVFEEIKNEGLITDYALIGGLALSAWVRPRTTRDIDLVVAVSKNLRWADLVSTIETRLHKKSRRPEGDSKDDNQGKVLLCIRTDRGRCHQYKGI